MSGFVEEFFLNPIKYPDRYAPYNVVNTLTFAVVGLLAAFLIYKFLEKNKIAVDKWLFFSVIPFIFFGSSMRVLEDAKLLPRSVEVLGFEIFPFVTPYIYFLTFLVLAISAACAFLLSKKFNLNGKKVLFKIGLVLAASVFLFAVSKVNRLDLLLAWLGVLAAVYLAFRFLYSGSFKPSFLAQFAFVAQSSDGVATFLGTKYLGYTEQHVVGKYLIGIGGPELFLLVKILFALLVVHVVEGELKEENQKNYVYLLITIFGLAPGLRDILRIAAGV